MNVMPNQTFQHLLAKVGLRCRMCAHVSCCGGHCSGQPRLRLFHHRLCMHDSIKFLQCFLVLLLLRTHTTKFPVQSLIAQVRWRRAVHVLSVWPGIGFFLPWPCFFVFSLIPLRNGDWNKAGTATEWPDIVQQRTWQLEPNTDIGNGKQLNCAQTFLLTTVSPSKTSIRSIGGMTTRFVSRFCFISSLVCNTVWTGALTR